ncbi:MAG: hypothetical protein DELT_02422 [Desulfovibrio sp.]
MYSKPLTNRMETGMREAPVKTSYRAPITSANFASYLPQAGAASNIPAQALSAQGMPGGAMPLEQAATQNNFGLNQMKALAALSAVNAGASSGAESKAAGKTDTAASPLGLPLNPRDIFRLLTKGAAGSMGDAEAAETSVRVNAHRKKTADSKERVSDVIARKLNGALDDFRQNSAAEVTVGRLAANFESGNEGIAAIGYDRHGGTSYGKYQLSSRAGTMKKFIGFLQTEAPDMAEKLQKAGAANAGGKRGKMPTAWKDIAESQPERFEELQDKFIRASHFEPAMKAIAEKTGIDRADMPFALQEVVFSTAVQHGPNAAGRIISRALGQVGENKFDPEKNEPETVAKAQENLIRKIYQNRSGQFRSSTETVQAAVKSRLKQEMSMAISMLREEYTATVKA